MAAAGARSSGADGGSDDRVCLGVIVGAHGVRGQVRIKSFTEDPADVAAYGPVSDAEGRRSFDLRVTGEAKGVVLAALSGVGDRNAAEALKGLQLFVPRAALPALEDEEVFYHADLIGLRAEDGAGRLIGRVKAVHDFGAGDLLELALEDEREHLVPFTRMVVPVVDLASGRVVVELPVETGDPEPAGRAGDPENEG